MGEEEDSQTFPILSSLLFPSVSPCLSLPCCSPTVKPPPPQPQLFGNFDQSALFSTQIANAFSFRKGHFSVTICFPLSTTLSNLISSFFQKSLRAAALLLYPCLKYLISHSGQSLAITCGWIILYTQCMFTYIHVAPSPLRTTNVKFAKPSSRELGNARVTVASNLNSISLCLCRIATESLTTSSHCHLILCTGCLPYSVPAWLGLSWTAAIQCFVFFSLFSGWPVPHLLYIIQVQF